MKAKVEELSLNDFVRDVQQYALFIFDTDIQECMDCNDAIHYKLVFSHVSVRNAYPTSITFYTDQNKLALFRTCKITKQHFKNHVRYFFECNTAICHGHKESYVIAAIPSPIIT